MKEPTNVDQLKKNCDIDGLIKILRFNKDPVVRNTVIDALVEIGEPATVPLVDLLRENNDDISGFVADAVKRLSDLRSEKQLIITLKNNTTGDPLFAVTGLAAIGGTESVNPLIDVLNNDNREIRITAAEALGNIGDRRAVLPLISSLNDHDLYVRWFVAEALGKLGDVRAVDPLIAILNEQNNFLIIAVAEALGRIGDARAVEPLISMLNGRFTGIGETSANLGERSNHVTDDNNYLIHCRVTSILTRIGFEFALNPLIVDIAKKSCSYPFNSLPSIPPIPRYLSDIIKNLLKNEECFVRIFCIEALGRIKNPPVISFLIEVLKRDNKFIRGAAKTSLENFGDAAIDPLISALKNDDRKIQRPIAEILGRIGNDSVVIPLITLLDNWDPYVRDTATEALKNLMKKQSISMVHKMRIAAVILKDTIT